MGPSAGPSTSQLIPRGCPGGSRRNLGIPWPDVFSKERTRLNSVWARLEQIENAIKCHENLFEPYGQRTAYSSPRALHHRRRQSGKGNNTRRKSRNETKYQLKIDRVLRLVLFAGTARNPLARRKSRISGNPGACSGLACTFSADVRQRALQPSYARMQRK
jgi:hypothetical protein